MQQLELDYDNPTDEPLSAEKAFTLLVRRCNELSRAWRDEAIECRSEYDSPELARGLELASDDLRRALMRPLALDPSDA